MTVGKSDRDRDSFREEFEQTKPVQGMGVNAELDKAP